VYAHGHELRAGIRLIRSLTDRPIGFNAIVEKSTRVERGNMERWVRIALEEGIRFFTTVLGNPRWVVEQVHAHGGRVYHDVTERKWADKALAAGVDGLICVNATAGGHAGTRSAVELARELGDLGVPLVCAGGVGNEADFVSALALGYAGVQLGTRFIATTECAAHADYKRAIVAAKASDIVLTDKISGVPVAVINTPYIQRVGTSAGTLAKLLLRRPRLKRAVRLYYSLMSAWQLKRSTLRGLGYRDYFMAGQSVEGVLGVEPAGDIVRRFAAAATSR
jgi:nitronate monooxygenase